MVADGVAILEAVSLVRPERPISGTGRPPPINVSPALCDDPSWVFSLRAEVEALRDEVRQVREEVEYWKAESHKHFCDAQYWRAMHQQALARIARRDQEI